MVGIIIFIALGLIIARMVAFQNEQENERWEEDEAYKTMLAHKTIIDIANKQAQIHNDSIDPTMAPGRNASMYNVISKYQYITKRFYNKHTEKLSSYDTQVWAVVDFPSGTKEGWIQAYKSSLRFGATGRTKEESLSLAKRLMKLNLEGANNHKAKEVFHLEPNLDTMFADGIKALS